MIDERYSKKCGKPVGEGLFINQHIIEQNVDFVQFRGGEFAK